MASRELLLATSLLAFACGWAAGDSVWIQSGSGNAIALSNVKVTGIDVGVDKEGKPVETLLFTTSAGRQSTRSLAQVPQITLDDEPAFSAAEEAFKGGDFGGAVENYRKALSITSKGWLKE